VLNWNGRDDTLACLSALANARYASLSPVVVDNASSDGSIEAIEARFPQVAICRNDENLGFAGGVNVGIERALSLGAEFVFVLNNDAIVEDDTIARLVETARSSPQTGGVSPVVCFADAPETVWFAGATFDPARGYPGRMLGYGDPVATVPSTTFETERLTGAAMLISRRCLEEVGPFDPELFFLCEDVDWSLRARARGYRLCVEPSARVLHRVARSQGGEHSPLSTYYGVRNQLEVSRRHAPLGRIGSLRRAAVCGLVYLARLRKTTQRRAGLIAWRDGVVDARRGRLGPWRRAPVGGGG
jgi:GT2 family glycosyltransferase